MEFCLKKLFILIIFLSILTLSTLNASDVSIDGDADLTDNADTANLLVSSDADNMNMSNSDYLNEETYDDDLIKENQNNEGDGETALTEYDSDVAGSETDLSEDNGMEENETKIKTTPKISIKTSKLKSRDTLTIL